MRFCLFFALNIDNSTNYDNKFNFSKYISNFSHSNFLVVVFPLLQFKHDGPASW